MRHFFALLAAFIVLVTMIVPSHGAGIPHDANRYRADLTRQARFVWGLDAPVADFAGQIHQESGWRADAKSQVGAQGLAQFMPATATWIDGLYKLGGAEVYNPAWAIRAMVTYDRHLWDSLPATSGDCHRMAWALRSYNGGRGYLTKEAKAVGGWSYAKMELACTQYRAGWACKENTEYPRRILYRNAPMYASWGPGSCLT